VSEDLIRALCDKVDADRLYRLTMELVRIPSPTGNSLAVSEYYAALVDSELGLLVEVIRDYPASPCTVARYGARMGARTLTMDGHLDTIHAPHPEPEFKDGRIYGRGAGDMKSGVAAMVEATRILIQSDVKLGGNLVLVTHSLHEAPVGHMEGLKLMLARGDIFGDAALVCEGGFDRLAIRGKGQALFEIDITREGEVCHENAARPRGISNPAEHAVNIAAAMKRRHVELDQQDDDLLGPETYFLGQIHSGDFYNRVPTRAFLNGTHRYWPDKEWQDVENEVRGVVQSVPLSPDLHVDMRLFGNGMGFQVDPQADIVRALQRGYHDVVGHELPVEGELSVSDVNVIAREGHIPVVAHGTGSTTAHADLEWVNLADIVRSTKVYLATIINYLGVV
jgi:acetylornithine deacetylase/succinyl-diaminopimelate desuccinylase-like protein